jgi:hypothetical protein
MHASWLAGDFGVVAKVAASSAEVFITHLDLAPPSATSSTSLAELATPSSRLQIAGPSSRQLISPPVFSSILAPIGNYRG